MAAGLDLRFALMSWSLQQLHLQRMLAFRAVRYRTAGRVLIPTSLHHRSRPCRRDYRVMGAGVP